MPSALGLAMVCASAFIFFAILAGFAVNRIIGWYIDGSISGVKCVSTIGLYIAVIALMIATPSMTLRISLAFFLFALILLLPVMSDHYGNHNNHLFNEEKIERHREALRRDPTNLAAKSKLSELLYEQGRLSEAIDELRQVVQHSPGSTSEAYRLKSMERERDEKKTPQVTCPTCGQKNPTGQRRCSNCEGELSMGREIRKWLQEGGLRQIVITSSITMGICAVVMFALSMLILPVRIGVVALLLIIVICSEALYIHKNW